MGRSKTGKEINCAICGKVIYKAKWQLKHKERYCSKLCFDKDRSKILKEIHRKKAFGFKKGFSPHNKGIKGFKHSGSFKKGHILSKGKNHWNWKGKVKHSAGYIKIQMPTHHYSDKDGYIFEHRLMMEKHLGRFLKPTEVIHHIDFNKTNNKINNLYLFPSNSAHRKYHEQLKIKAMKIYKEIMGVRAYSLKNESIQKRNNYRE